MGDVIGWEGLVLPYGEVAPVGDPRVVLPTTYELSRPLPLPVKVQWSSAAGHDNAEQGLALITRVWSTDEGLWASGPIDTDDDAGARLARKLGAGFLGFVSADIETDGGQVINTAEGRRPAFQRWRLAGVTLVGDPAFAAARIHPVTDPSRITPVDQISASEQTFAAADDVRVVRFAVGTPTTTDRSTVDIDNTAAGGEPGAAADADDEKFAVVDSAVDDIVDGGVESGVLTDTDIARIADAVAARLAADEAAVQIEFQRISDARAALEEE